MVFNVSDASGVGEVRRAATHQCKLLGFDEKDAGRVAIVVTEIGTNIVKHAKNGMINLENIAENGAVGLQILGIDSGPGHSDVERCLNDGYSTAGTAGNGLGAIRRMSDVFDIHSIAGVGTIVLGQVWAKGLPTKVRRSCPQFGAVTDPFPGETECGDVWASAVSPERILILIADGLGHGIMAHEASTEAVRFFRHNETHSAANIVDAIHAGIRHTRGCAIAVSEIKLAAKSVNYSGMGNICGCMIGGGQPKRNMISMNGTAGHNGRKAKEFSYPLLHGSILIMHSDGIDTRWDLATLPGIENRHSAIIAAALFRGHRRIRDDATVVVMKPAQGD